MEKEKPYVVVIAIQSGKGDIYLEKITLKSQL